jgi:hypothetical protein
MIFGVQILRFDQDDKGYLGWLLTNFSLFPHTNCGSSRALKLVLGGHVISGAGCTQELYRANYQP